LTVARARGVTVIDTEPIFRAHLAHSTLKLEMSPADAHWNALANQLVATAVADALQGGASP